MLAQAHRADDSAPVQLLRRDHPHNAQKRITRVGLQDPICRKGRDNRPRGNGKPNPNPNSNPNSTHPNPNPNPNPNLTLTLT